MSLILDALRKMELERKAKRLGSAELRAEVLNYRGNPPVPEKSRLLPVLAALLLFAGAAGALLYVRTSAPPPEPPPAPAANRLPPSTPAPPPLPLPSAVTAPPAAASRAPAAVKPSAAAEESRQPAGDSAISVSGIAWQEEHSLRRAVVNGALVGEGAEVAGTKVIEIRENLVRFSQGGKTFEVIYMGR
jgi:general secretion pathway protein B